MDSATAHINRIRASKALAAYSVVIPTRIALARAPWLQAGPPVRARCGSLDLRSHFDGAYVPWCLRTPVYYSKEKPLVPGSHGSLLLSFLFFSSLFPSLLFPSLPLSSPFLPFSVSSIKLSPAPKICRQRLVDCGGESFSRLALTFILFATKTSLIRLTIMIFPTKTPIRLLKRSNSRVK